MAPQNRITELAASIADDTATVDKYFISKGIPTPSFDVNGPATVTVPAEEKDVAAAHARVVANTQELHNLMKGPTDTTLHISVINFNDVLSMQSVWRFRIAQCFELDEKVSFETLSQRCGVNVVDLQRLVRHAMTNHIFREEDGMVAHTAASRMLRENKLVGNVIGVMTEEIFQGASKTVDALDEHKVFRLPNQSGFSMGHNTDKGLYDELRQYPDRAERFATAMSGFASRTPIDPLARGFDWGAFAAQHATVVDIGGGWGPVSISLAQRFPGIRFIVQDFADVIAEGPSHVPDDLTDRVEFMEADFLAEQPVHGADIYFMRAVLHNWTDEFCVKILRNLIPALKKGSHVVINDAILWEPWSLPPYLEKFRRSMDLNMMTLFGSRERSLEEWKTLITEADPRFRLNGVFREGTGVLDLVWED